MAEDDELRLPTMRGFDPSAVDVTVDPCEDFYRYACGGWHERHPRPLDVSFWSRAFTQFERQIDTYLRDLIEDRAQARDDRSLDEQKVGDFFAACMDTATIEDRGLAPFQAELSLIEGMSSLDQLATVVGTLTRAIPPRGKDAVLFTIHVYGDPEDGGQAKRIWIDAVGGLGLANRQHYLEQGEEARARRDRFRAHVARMLRLAGLTSAEAGRRADEILILEAALAEHMMSDAAAGRNDASAFTNSMTPAELQDLTSGFAWADFFRALGVEEDGVVNVTYPPYLEELSRRLRSESLETWRAYLSWRWISIRAPLLTREIREAHFDFYGRDLGGLEAQRNRVQTCSEDLSRYLPASLSRVFLEHAFDPGMRVRALQVFKQIQKVMRRRIEQSDWLAVETQAKALEKLDAMRVSVAHPSKWLDDHRLVIRRDDHYGNVRRAAEALRRVAFAKLGRPIDLDAWRVPTTSTYAYYDSHANAVIVAAGMLLFYETQDPAQFYAGVGVTMAHEILHGFDSHGRAYDALGRLRDWWTQADATRFEDKAQCVAEQFSRLEYAPGVALDGDYVVSEQTAELGAWSIAWDAYQDATAGAPQSDVGGFTAPQLYFLTTAQTWCTDATQERWRDLVHSGGSKAWGAPMVNGIALNLPEFRQAFSCEDGDPMTLPCEEMCKVW